MTIRGPLASSVTIEMPRQIRLLRKNAGNLRFGGRGDAVDKCVGVLLATLVTGATAITMSAAANRIVRVCFSVPF